MSEQWKTPNALIVAVSRITATEPHQAKQIIHQVFDVISKGLTADSLEQFHQSIGLEHHPREPAYGGSSSSGQAREGETDCARPGADRYHSPLPPEVIAEALLCVVARDFGISGELVAEVGSLLGTRTGGTFELLYKYPPIA